MSYNPSQTQRAYDKLHSTWEYLNWMGDTDDPGVRDAKNLISSITHEFIREIYRNGNHSRLSLSAGQERGKKWSRICKSEI